MAHENLPEMEAVYPEIAREIEEMCRIDQKGRTGDSVDEMIKIDRVNTLRMKEIVGQIGWPTASKVGMEISHQAWLLVQHADFDVEFQKQCLSLMEAESENEVSEGDIAYLYDRVCVNEGRPQFYGTQFTEDKNGAYGPQPIEDIEHVDERRKALGFDTLVEYKESLIKKYNMKGRSNL